MHVQDAHLVSALAGEGRIFSLHSVTPVKPAAAAVMRLVCPNQTTVPEHRPLYSSAFHQLITLNHFHEVGHL